MFYICLQWKGWHQQMQHPLYIKRWYMNKMSLCHQLPPQWVQPPIGLKWAFNFDLEATWQLFIPQVWANQNLWYHFYHILDYWGYFIIYGYVAINFYNPQMFKCVVCHHIVLEFDAWNLSQGKKEGFWATRKTMAQIC